MGYGDVCSGYMGYRDVVATWGRGYGGYMGCGNVVATWGIWMWWLFGDVVAVWGCGGLIGDWWLFGDVVGCLGTMKAEDYRILGDWEG